MGLLLRDTERRATAGDAGERAGKVGQPEGGREPADPGPGEVDANPARSTFALRSEHPPAPPGPVSDPFTGEPAYLLLEDGRRFDGRTLGAAGTALGEVVFNTSMTGYQEILTDPSYAGQIVVMTYPLIGNYGVNREDEESERPQAAGFVVREAAEHTSSWRAT
ncbi:MAG: hypothetical protein GWM92_05765, partial [Gemmatimonadetes bacterium]|nr:hypothetical protein [Gemmatimonadota bacterium]NIR78102.1 hypothetical protein [Gemmatimonadota bacterium]NIT86669.1 hypothetical protein [Gemmatimonadota bacterium]NIU30522.1 hypothetical protein [Gemmatimonadota bacterium]NIU35361.1 hypothetical protein [Gemmatimonadota bacterium]